MIVAITLMLILQLGNAQNIPSMGCSFNISCKHRNKILEIPAYPVPIKLIIDDINYTSQVLEAHDPENCLSRLLYEHNFSLSIFPLRISGTGLEYWPFDELGIDVNISSVLTHDNYNVSFFDCSSLGHGYAIKDTHFYFDNKQDQDMISCPMYIAQFDEDMVRSNLVFCTKLSQRVSPFILSQKSLYGIRLNSITLSWSETNLDKGCFKCKNKSKKKIILTSAG
jgi:hypothetical protein